MSEPTESLTPRQFALLLLGSGDAAPRKRARDQQADITGLEIKRRVLTELIAVDPEPEEVEAVLMAIVEEIGPPTGPTRSVALTILEEWRMAREAPAWVEQLLAEAVRPRRPEGGRRGRELPQ
jgi:hypothetical protein